MTVEHPGTQEPLIAAYTRDGQVAWALSGALMGASVADETLVAVDCNSASRLCVTGGTISPVPAGTFACTGSIACSAATILLVHTRSAPADVPVSTHSITLGGDGVAAEAVDVATRGDTVTVSGVARRASGATDTGSLFVPDRIGATTGGVSIEVPPSGEPVTWVAHYTTTAGIVRLAWATALHGDTTATGVSVADVVATGSGFALCASATGDVTVSTAVPGGVVVPSLPGQPNSTATVEFVADGQALLLSLAATTGIPAWSQWLSAPATGTLTCATLATAGNIITASGSVTGALSYTAGTQHMPLDSSETTMWMASFNAGTGTATQLGALGSTPLAPSAGGIRDTVASVVMDAVRHRALVVSTSSGGELRSATAGTAGSSAPVLVRLAGDAARPAPAASGSADVVVAAWQLPTGGKPLTDTMPLVAPGGLWSTTQLAGVGLGELAGASYGRRYVMTVGAFKGTLVLDDSSALSASSLGSPGDATHGHDPLLVLHDASSRHATPLATLPLIGTGIDAADRFTGAAASPDGSFHYISGYAAAGAVASAVQLGEKAAVLPGDGGRDGFVAAISDRDGAVAWMRAVGAVQAVDDTLSCVAASNSLVAAGGAISGAVPSWGSRAVYSDAVEDRTLGVVYTMDATAGSELWAKAFGTDTSTGTAAVHSVAVVAGTAGEPGTVVVAGSFAGGSLVVGEYTLEPPAANPQAETAFVVALKADTGTILWARAAVTVDGVPSPLSFSTSSGVAASPSAVALAGTFLFPASGRIGFHDDMFGSQTVKHTDVPHAFVAVLDLTTGAPLSLTVPHCEHGCEATAVAVEGGRAAALFSYTRSLSFHVDTDNTGTAAWHFDETTSGPHSAAVLLGGLGGRDVLGVQRLSAGRGHSVRASAVAFGRGLVAGLAVAGWRDGSVALRDTMSPSMQFAGAVFHQPVLGLVDVTPGYDLQSTTPLSGTASPVLFGSTGTGATPLSSAVRRVVAGMGLHTALTAVTVGGNAALRGDVGEALVDTAAVVGGGGPPTTEALLVATQRGSGSELWSWRLGSDASVAGVTSTPDGNLLCLVATVANASNAGAVPAVWGVDASPLAVGAGDILVACFNDAPDTALSHPTPVWVTLLATPLFQRATAVAATNQAIFVGLQSSDSLPFSDGFLPTSSRPGIACVIGVLNPYHGTPVTGVFFGGADSGEECRVHSVAASPDATLVCAAGTYSGASLPISSQATLYPSDPSLASAFVVCYSGPNNGGDGPYSLLWASGSEFDVESDAPLGDVAATATSIALSGDSVIVSGMYHSAGIEWGNHQGVGLGTPRTATSVPTDASVPPRTAYVAAFDIEQQGPEGVASWVSSLPSTSWDGIQAVAGVALADGGRVLAAVTTASPLFVSPFRDPVSAPIAPGATQAAGTYTVVASLDVATGAYRGASVVGDPSADLAVLSQIASTSLASAPRLSSSSGLGDGLILVGAARGQVSSGLSTVPSVGTSALSAADTGDFIVFHAGVGAVSLSSHDGVSVENADASSIADLRDPHSEDTENGHYVVQFEVWRSHGSAVIARGSWRSGSEYGPGVTFAVPPAVQAAQAASPATWLLVEAPVTAATIGAGAEFGAIGGSVLGDLNVFTVQAALSDVDVSPQWRIRHARLVPRFVNCVPCGQVPIRRQAIVLERPEVPSAEEGSLVELVPADPLELLLPQPIDATTIVDPACNCLRLATVEWEQPADAFPVEVVALRSFAGAGSRVLSNHVTTTPSTSGDPTWVHVSAELRVEHHVDTANIDWQSLGSLSLLTQAPMAAANSSMVPAASMTLRELVLRRACPTTSTVLHPRPNTEGTTFMASRNTVHMEQGKSYRVLTVETNMFGDQTLPVCSPPFIVDATPPEVASATVIDLDASDIARIKPRVDVAYTPSHRLTLAWDGQFADPDSDTAGVLRYRISQVAVGSVAGALLQDVTSEDKLLPLVSSDDVSTGELPLQDGETYHAFLDVCNVSVSYYLCCLQRCLHVLVNDLTSLSGRACVPAARRRMHKCPLVIWCHP